MTEDRSRPDASSTSRRKPSARSRRPDEVSSGSASPGDAPTLTSASPAEPPSDALGAGAIRELARRHGIRPTKAFGQNFLIDPSLAGAIVADAGVGEGDRVVEVGAGFGSLTVALAATGAEVLAVEFDRGLVAALGEVVAPLERVTVIDADVM